MDNMVSGFAISEIRNDISIVKQESNILKSVTGKLAQGMGFYSEALQELTSSLTHVISEEVKNQVKEEIATTAETVKGEVLATVDGRINDTVKDAVNDRGLNRLEGKMLTDARNKRMRELMGHQKSDQYILFTPFYQSLMGKEYRKQFECAAYADVRPDRLDEALEFINNFTVSDKYHDWCVSTLHKNYANNEIESNKKLNAYRRYFGIEVQ